MQRQRLLLLANQTFLICSRSILPRFSLACSPEGTVLIHRMTKDRRAGEYRLHIKKVLNYKHWDKRGQRPKR
jgi:hypothetical protein